MVSGGITPDTPPCPVFSGKEGGYLEQNFFIRDFLTKKFSGASRRRKIRGGGVSGVIPSDNCPKRIKTCFSASI